MIILLVLLPALVSGAREPVDWTKCELDMKCFCGSGPDPLVLVQREDNGQGCEKVVGVQHQFFTENSALIQVQFPVDPTDPVLSGQEKPRITIMYGSTKLFGCEYDKKKRKGTLFGDKKMIFDNKIKLFEEKFEERSYLDADSVACAVTVGRVSKFDQKTLFPLGNEKIAIMWSAGDSDANSKKFEFPVKGRDFFRSDYPKCNPSFKDLLYSQDYYVEPIRNKDRFKLNCDNYGESYTMRYEKAGVVNEMKQLECIKTGMTAYSYSIDTKDDAGVDMKIDVPDPESYSFFCTRPFNELCENPNTCTKDDPTCPAYEAGRKGVAATLTCPYNKWKIKDEFYVLKDPACERNTILAANGASFVAVLPSGQRVPITRDLNARCFTDWDCVKKSHLNVPNSGSVIINEGIMKCNDTEAQMIVFHNETNTTMTGARSYKCNPAEGFFFNEANEEIKENSRVSCRVNKTVFTTTEEASISKQQAILIVAGVGGLFLIAVVGAMIGGFCCWRHRNDVSIRNLKDMKRDALAEKCKKDFRYIIKATPSNAYLIVDGLTLVDKMLEVEADDPKAWEEAGKFLMRVHGAVMRSDFQVWHMLSRYCHAQATKILDKYGWQTDAPITRDCPKGQIRVVAVQLLAFCLNDHANYTAEEEIEWAYGKLAFDGASQYPHCGVLWSVAPHARRGQYLKTHKGQRFLVRGFNKETFCEKMRKIACKKVPIAIPDHEVIPAFGTVAEQAAYALGGSPFHTYLANNTSKIMFGDEMMAAVCAPTAYLRGMIESRGRDPAQILLEACQMFKKLEKHETEPAFLTKMNLLAPEPVWHSVWRNAFQLLAFYGRDLDIRRVHSSFMPKDKSIDFFEMQMEQANFEKAIDEDIEDIRKWFAKHTDRDEFKQKSITAVNPKVKLRDRRFVAGPAGGCGSSSDKSSGAGRPPKSSAAAVTPAAGASRTPVVAAGTPPAPPAAGSPGAAPAAAAAAPAAAPAAPTAAPPAAAPAAPAAAAAVPVAAPATPAP